MSKSIPWGASRITITLTACSLLLISATADAETPHVLLDAHGTQSELCAYPDFSGNENAALPRCFGITNSDADPRGLAYEPNQSVWFLSFASTNAIQIVTTDLVALDTLVIAPEASSLTSLVYDARRRLLYTIDAHTSHLYIFRWLPDTYELISAVDEEKGYITLPADPPGVDLALDVLASRLFVLGTDQIVRAYDLNSLTLLDHYQLQQPADRFAVDGARNQLYYGGYRVGNWTLSQYDIATNREQSVDLGHDVGVLDLGVDALTGIVNVVTGRAAYTVASWDFTARAPRCLRTQTLDALPVALTTVPTQCSPLNLSIADTLPADGCITPGQPLSYDISIGSADQPRDTYNVVLRIRLPVDLAFESATGGGKYEPSDHTVNWELGTIPAGTPEQVVELHVRLSQTVLLENELTLEAALTAFAMPPVSASTTTTICDNTAPLCDAGGPYENLDTPGDTTIQLDGSGSHDPDVDDELTFFWWSDCPEAVFDDPASPAPVLTLTPDCDTTCLVHLRVTDPDGAASECQATVHATDVTAPTFTAVPTDLILPCDTTNKADRVQAWLSDIAAEDANGPVEITNDFSGLSNGCGESGNATVNWFASDACGNETYHTATIAFIDQQSPDMTVPPDITVTCTDYWSPNTTGWATATDGCDPAPQVLFQDNVNPPPGWWHGTITRTWIASDDCGNETHGEQLITVIDPRSPYAAAGTNLRGAGTADAAICYEFPEPPPEQPEFGPPGIPRALGGNLDGPPAMPVPVKPPRVTGTEKGSLLVYPKVEIRFNDQNEIVQDTFITLNNDWNGDVHIQAYFVCEAYDYRDVFFLMTHNETAHWSAAFGAPKDLSPWTVLGNRYPDPEGTGDTIMRGYIVLWAVTNDYHQLRWNHLYGGATIVNYRDRDAWEYNAYAFQVVDDDVEHGDTVGTAGDIQLDGEQYDHAYDVLNFDFFASYSNAMSTSISEVTHDSDLILLPVNMDFCTDGGNPATTKAQFQIFNANEVAFSGMEYCLTKWDERRLSYEGGHFLVQFLQTDKGHARVHGLASSQCPNSTDQPLLGVITRLLTVTWDPPPEDE